jgi:hypothetical protein
VLAACSRPEVLGRYAGQRGKAAVRQDHPIAPTGRWRPRLNAAADAAIAAAASAPATIMICFLAIRWPPRCSLPGPNRAADDRPSTARPSRRS